jgi:transposase/uncharacterized coiled-coil protein SlyX
MEHQLAQQAQLIELLSAQVAKLEEKIALQEVELSVYRVKKDSSNSSVPPSQDPNRVKRTSSLREKSGRKPGGQPGHEGSFLETPTKSDMTIIHTPGYCTKCSKDLSTTPSEFIGKRHVIDIPKIVPFVTEHQIHGKHCSCGHFTGGEYPVEAHSSVCYGANVQALTAYLHSRQYIPFARMGELYRDIFSLSISNGSLVNIVESFADKCKNIYEEIRRRVSVSPVVGADETGCRINGKNKWAWVFQTPSATYIHVGNSRGKKTIDEVFPDGFPKSILVHDCWRSYFNVKTNGHQNCTSHFFRELKYFDKFYPNQQWSANFAAMLRRALQLKRETDVCDNNNVKFTEQRALIEKDCDALLCENINADHKELITFKERMVKYRDHLFVFLYNTLVPPHNNASERAIRTFKVKQKVSGQFRAASGAKAFAVIRSIIDTTIKNAQNVWEALTLIPHMPVAFIDDS